MTPASFPSPSSGVLHLGPVPLRAYAFAIIVGVVVAVAIANRRAVERGGRRDLVSDMALWAVPAGIVGARVYSLVTSPQNYFGHGHTAYEWVEVWHGGLGIWGGVAGGAAAVWFWARREGVRYAVLADAVAPGIAVAQALGRIGNYFNQELYGRATTLPWAVRIDAAHSPDGLPGTYHPTFLYELLWDLVVAAVCVAVDRRARLGSGRVFALYVALYCVGRSVTEALRIDDANHVLGLRLNDVVAAVVFLLATAFFVGRRGRADREIYLPGRSPAGLQADGTVVAADGDGEDAQDLHQGGAGDGGDHGRQPVAPSADGGDAGDGGDHGQRTEVPVGDGGDHGQHPATTAPDVPADVPADVRTDVPTDVAADHPGDDREQAATVRTDP